MEIGKIIKDLLAGPSRLTAAGARRAPARSRRRYNSVSWLAANGGMARITA